jgi:predicted nuclease of predicted toxin-antitoxin system
MALAFYMDHNVPSAITNGLRLRSVDVITAYEDSAHELDDSTLLDRASAMQRIVFTRDKDFLIEATRRQRLGIPFYGIIYAHQRHVSIGTCVEQLELIAKIGQLDDVVNLVKHLPLW